MPEPEPVLQIKLTGREAETRLPSLLVATSRSATQAHDVFLPPGYLQPTRTFDVGPAARGMGDPSTQQAHNARADEVIVLELTDGSTLITSAERLRDSLARTHPELIGDDGAIQLEKLRADGAAPHRGFGEAVGGLISKVYTLVAGKVPDAIIQDALGHVRNPAELGVSWAGTKALMEAVENRLDQAPGLYRWRGASGTQRDLVLAGLVNDKEDTAQAEPDKHPMLVFVHGTGSSTLGSFGDLRSSDRDLWGALEDRFTGGLFAFEHRTLSKSPIDNAIDLVASLPRGAHVSLVSHSRGGMVADLLCLSDFDALIERYTYDFEGTGDADPQEANRVLKELDLAHADQRRDLSKLAGLLRKRKIVVKRYVRVASPANGTKLASGNFDVFLSGLLTLIGAVPFFFGNPVYSAFKRIVIEIVKNRTNPHLVPGIEAMLPDSPMARLLRDAPVQPDIAMAVIAGDIEGGNLLKRLGVLLTDFLLFDSDDNDLIVNTSSMLAGIAPKAASRVLFDRGADVSHFRYFSNIDTRAALRDWLIADDTQTLDTFRALPDASQFAAALAAASASRDAAPRDRPVVVVLPGVMGSHLSVGLKDRVWFNPVDIARGGMSKIAWGSADVEAEELFAMSYGRICKHLSDSHRVEPFPYDWRQPLDVLGERLGQFLDRLLNETQAPIRLLAHSMGGLVVRACIYKRRSVMNALMARDGARLVMLATPHQGAHSMVENLLGKGDTLRTLVRLDLSHSMQEVLDIVAGFRGALQLLPKPDFVDTFQDRDDGGMKYKYQKASTWDDLKTKVTDLWFGDHHAGTPDQDVLNAAAWLWDADGPERPALPVAYEKASVYVFGVARNTPCGVREEADSKGGVRLKMVGTTRGDGTVSWASGRIGGIGSFYYLPAEHGDLAATVEYFPALTELLASGATAALSTQPPAVRAIEQPEPVSYDAGPPSADDTDALLRGLMGGSLRNRVPPRPKRRLEVTVKAMDLRFLSQPIIVGHYEQDPIAGAEALIDRELLDGDLSERHSLGLYAGARGTAVVVLRVPNEIERERGSMTGAVVTGLGRYDVALSAADLTESVRTGALRYLLQVVDVLGKTDREVPLATLLLGFNSTANMTVGASVEALVRGVMEANAKFYDTTRLNIRIARLDIVELYLDTAITAVYALRQLAQRLGAQAEKQGTTLVTRAQLVQGEGVRQRLFDDRNASYWPKLIITDADRNDERCPPACFDGANNGPLALSAVGAVPTLLADRLRFLYVGQRARAETVEQQRQPGLIEQLIRQQIHDAAWNENFGRMLFQLMVPHNFKDAARGLDRLVLVVDSYTANLPWELMIADDPARTDNDKLPLALRARVVRQLSSIRFRPHVRQAMQRRALVIGNPSVDGFAAAFPPPPGQQPQQLPSLQGAEDEATATAAILGNMGYDVTRVIGNSQPAVSVLTRLYEQPWRILHISAHGVFNLRHADGRYRSGVLLSDGLLITAAEIAAMEVVPELVFLNCCHLGQLDIGRDGNKLAASVARELIDIGVRCVIVAGWAVNDDSAKLFGETFYQALLLGREPFGDAVFTARRATWQANRQDITWGAFQAYGEPGWLAEPRAVGLPGGDSSGLYASPDELLDDLARTRADLSRRRGRISERESRTRADGIAALLKTRCPAGWKQLPQIQSALGVTWYELNELERAHEALLAAVQAEDKIGLVPIRDIEKLANVEARLGEKRAEAELDAAHGQPGAQTAEALIDLALRRLDGLDALLSAQVSGDAPSLSQSEPQLVMASNSERSGLRGSAWKRKASLRARRLARGGLGVAEQRKLSGEMTEYLNNAIAAYAQAEGHPGSSQFVPYLAVNRLMLDSLTEFESPEQRDNAISLAQQCRRRAEQDFALSPNSWDAVVQPEAMLVECLLNASLGRPGEAGQAVFEAVARAYADAMSNITVKPVQINSMVTQMDLMSRFCDALSVVRRYDRTLARTADQLIALAQRIEPGRTPRNDRPRRRPRAASSRKPAAGRKKPAHKPSTKPMKQLTAKNPAAKSGRKR
ncbi:MAG: CHAT domain-containing protein [Betaproteobacteria bacterium]